MGAFTPRRMPMYATMYMKKKDLQEIRGIGWKLYLTGNKGFIYPGADPVPEKGELKNAGISHDVVENKYRKNSGVRVSHDVYENRRLISSNPRCV
jgi:hypothetical protein